MISEVIYAISNSSMNLYPNNSRAKFCSKLPKELIATKKAENYLWLSVENIILANTLVNYQKSDTLPDIIFKNVEKEQNKLFYMPERCFETERSI